jgi:hypothetical protein
LPSAGSKSKADAFQFDWSTEYLVIGGMHRRLEVAHAKLACQPRLLLVAYYQPRAHEMLFDAHMPARLPPSVACPARHLRQHEDGGGQSRPARERNVNARFHAMTGHYLFEPEFCNRAAAGRRGRSRRTFRTGADTSGARPANGAGH